MTQIDQLPVTRVIDYKHSQLVRPFYCQSDILKKAGHNPVMIIPVNFVMDWESVPLLKGTSKVGGLIHDYLCRIDSCPAVSKKVAADVYLEFMKFRGNSYIRRYVKYWVVRVAHRYYHVKYVDWPGPDQGSMNNKLTIFNRGG